MALGSSIAGSWYPGSADAIRAICAQWEVACISGDSAIVSPNVLILPHAGWAYSGKIAWKAVRTVRDAGFRRVVILAPSHRAWIENRLVAPQADAVSTPLGEIAVDRDWLDALALIAPVNKNDRIHSAEHSTQIEYPLLQMALGCDFKIVPLVIGKLDSDQMGMCARALSRLMDAETLLVISSDFTHYGEDFDYAPYGTTGCDDVRPRVAAVDAQALSFIADGDADAFAAYIQETGATICGHVPIELAMRSFPKGTKTKLLEYATSGDAEGDFSRFVCYAAAIAHAEWAGEGNAVLDAEARSFLLRLARNAIECAMGKGDFTIPANVPKSALAKMGAFITLNDKATGALRGCIGEILPMRPLVQAVAARAVDAALNDPRFMPVTAAELDSLRIEISALTPPKPVASWRDIVLGRDGMTLEKGAGFAVFLPQVAPEQGWDLPTTLSYLSQKAGLPYNAWQSGAKFETFQAEVFHE